MLLTSMVNILFEMNRADSIFMQQVREENSRRTPLASMTCTEICGNGARTTGWTTIAPPQEIAVLINTKITIITSPAADRGMSRQNSVAVQRACEYWDQMRMSLRGL